MNFGHKNKIERLLPVESDETLVIAPSGGIFSIPQKTRGIYDELGRRQGKHTAVSSGSCRLFPETMSLCTFKDDCLIHIKQYKKQDSKFYKCLECDIKNNRVVGYFFAITHGQIYDGIVDSDKNFTGWCCTQTQKKWYMQGLCHGVCQEKSWYNGERTIFKSTYDHGHLDGLYSCAGKTFYKYGYIKDGQVVVEHELNADKYPVLKKLGLIGWLGEFLTYSQQKKIKSHFDNHTQRYNYRSGR